MVRECDKLVVVVVVVVVVVIDTRSHNDKILGTPEANLTPYKLDSHKKKWTQKRNQKEI